MPGLREVGARLLGRRRGKHEPQFVPYDYSGVIDEGNFLPDLLLVERVVMPHINSWPLPVRLVPATELPYMLGLDVRQLENLARKVHAGGIIETVPASIAEGEKVTYPGFTADGFRAFTALAIIYKMMLRVGDDPFADKPGVNIGLLISTTQSWLSSHPLAGFLHARNYQNKPAIPWDGIEEGVKTGDTVEIGPRAEQASTVPAYEEIGNSDLREKLIRFENTPKISGFANLETVMRRIGGFLDVEPENAQLTGLLLLGSAAVLTHLINPDSRQRNILARRIVSADDIRLLFILSWQRLQDINPRDRIEEIVEKVLPAVGTHQLAGRLRDFLEKRQNLRAGSEFIWPAAVGSSPKEIVVFDGAGDKAILAEPVTVEEEPATAVVVEGDGLREEIATIPDGGLREYLTNVYGKVSQVMRERGAEWPIPGPWTYKFFQEALGASYGEILDFYRKVAANKYVVFGPYKAGKTGAYMMDLPAFLAFAALLEILPGVLGASGRPDWKAAVSRTKNILGQVHVIADKLKLPVEVEDEKLPPAKNPPPASAASSGLIVRLGGDPPLPAVLQSDEMPAPPPPRESAIVKIFGQEVNLTELFGKIEPSSRGISPQELSKLLGVQNPQDAEDMAWELVEMSGGSRGGDLSVERLSAVVWEVIQRGKE